MALPANISTRWVEGQFLTNVNDGPDPDQKPDGLAARGTVTFVAAVPYLPDATAVPNPATLLMIPRVAVLDEEGYICTPVRGTLTPAYRGIMLECTDDPDGSVTGWTWNVKYTFMPVDGVTPTIDSHSFPLPASDVALDLTTVVKVPSSAGIGKEQAEVLAASAQAAAVRAAADAAKAMAAAEEALGAAEATDSNVSSLVGTEGTETNAAVARQVESAAASKLDADEAAGTYQSIEGLDAVAASKINAENSSLRRAVDARAQAAASSKLDATQAADTFATKDELGDVQGMATDAGIAATVAGGAETKAALVAVTEATLQGSEFLREEFIQDQTDYVSILAARSRTNRLMVRKSGDGAGSSFDVSAVSGVDHITSTFNGIATGDKYHRIWETWHGPVTTSYANGNFIGHDGLTFTGTWSGVAGQYDYATSVGATFTARLVLPHTLNAINFAAYRDPRGGLWNFTLTGADGNAMTASSSTWGSGAATASRRLFSDIAAGTYTLVATFAGDDPANIPSTGAGTARGWIGRKDLGGAVSVSHTLVTLTPTMTFTREQRIAPVSNWDIALLVRPTGAASYEWVPEHSGINSSVLAENPKFYNGNTPLDMDAMLKNATVTIDGTFEMVQHIYGRHTSQPGVNLIEYWTSHRFHPDGRVTVTGKWKALQNLEIDGGYVLMLPVEGSVFDKVITSYGNTYANTADMYGKRTFLRQEADTATSYVFASSLRKDLAIAVTYRNAAETMRRGRPGKPGKGAVSFIEHQDATKTKLYQQLFTNNSSVAAGTVHRFSGDFIRVSAPGVHDYLSLT